MKDLSQRQQELLLLIRKYWNEHGVPPTRLELAGQLGRAASTIEQHLQALAGKSYLNLVPGSNRNIRLNHDFLAQMELSETLPDGLPLIGRVAAGTPILAEQNIEEYCRINTELFSPTPDYLLRVYGHSMRDAGILDGDLLAVHSTGDVHNKQIVVARLDEEATVKRFERVNEQLIRLWPENPAYRPIEVDLAQQPLVVEGLVVGVIRNGSI